MSHAVILVTLIGSKEIRAPLPFVYGWWTDFRDEDHKLSGRILRLRRIVSRSQNTVELEDVGRMLWVSYTDHVHITLNPPSGWTAEYDSNRFHAYSVYSLTQKPDATLLHVKTEVRFRNLILRILAPLAKPFIERAISKEWDDYAELIEENYEKTLHDSSG